MRICRGRDERDSWPVVISCSVLGPLRQFLSSNVADMPSCTTTKINRITRIVSLRLHCTMMLSTPPCRLRQVRTFLSKNTKIGLICVGYHNLGDNMIWVLTHWIVQGNDICKKLRGPPNPKVEGLVSQILTYVYSRLQSVTRWRDSRRRVSLFVFVFLFDRTIPVVCQ